MSAASRYQSRSFQVGPSSVQLVADDQQFLSAVEALFVGFDDAVPRAGEKLVVVNLTSVGAGRWNASHEGASICHRVDEHNLALAVTRFLNRYVLDHEPQVLHFHAGAVAKGATTALIVGHSLAGKSTLVAALVSRGWAYLSDEQVAIEPHGGLRPFPRPITLRADSWKFFDRELFPVATPACPDRVEIAPSQLGQVYKGEALPPTIVIRPDVSEVLNTVSALSAADTLAHLLGDTLDLERAGESGVNAMVGVVVAAPGYFLAGQDLDETCRSIEALAAAATPPGAPIAEHRVRDVETDMRLGGVRSWLFPDQSAAIYDPASGQLLQVDAAGFEAWQVLGSDPSSWPAEAAMSPFVAELRAMGLLVDQTR